MPYLWGVVMSFSREVKEEILKQCSTTRHCQIAEFAAIMQCSGGILPIEQGQYGIRISTENEGVARKCFTILRKTFNIKTDVILNSSKAQAKSHIHHIIIHEARAVNNILQTVKFLDVQGNKIGCSDIVQPLLIKNACCRRSFLRGAYLAIGSMSNPEKSYHLEFTCSKQAQAEQLREIMNDFSVEAKIIIRKKYYVVYVKESACIVELLNIIGAHISLMELENMRIIKEVRNSVNRRVNCEAANISKTVAAASNQIRDILRIRDLFGLSRLSPNLREMAEVRLENPGASLKELGELLSPPVGKSGVNHRLRKLSELADKLET